MVKRRILELMLDSIRVPQTGKSAGGGESRHIARISLIWPRMAIAHKTVVRAVRISNGAYTPSTASWTERALFKEAVEGPFGISVEISEAVGDAQWNDAIARLGSAVWSMAGTQFVDSTGNPMATLLWRMPFDFLSRSASASAKNEPRIIASGTLDMQCDEWPALQDKPLSLAMSAPGDIVRVSRRRIGGKLQTKRETAIKQNEPNGKTVFNARVYR